MIFVLAAAPSTAPLTFAVIVNDSVAQVLVPLTVVKTQTHLGYRHLAAASSDPCVNPKKAALRSNHFVKLRSRSDIWHHSLA